MWRRVVPSPAPRRIFQIRPIRWLLERGAIVICTGGGGIPTMFPPGSDLLVGAEVVIDKDRASALLARELDADVFVMATDVDAVYDGWGTPDPLALNRITASELRARRFAPGSMGPKVEAAVDFVVATGRRAAIGTLSEVEALVAGTAGTNVVAP
jgi:carbamate kinase